MNPSSPQSQTLLAFSVSVTATRDLTHELANELAFDPQKTISVVNESLVIEMEEQLFPKRSSKKIKCGLSFLHN